MTSVGAKCLSLEYPWLQFRWEVNCAPLCEQCWAGQKEYMRFLRLIKSSSSIFALFFPQSDEKLQDSHVPQDQIALLLYCFIFILLINTAKELLFFFVEKHELFVIALTLLYLIKNLGNYLLVICSSSPLSAFAEIPDCDLQCSDVRMKGTLQEGWATWCVNVFFLILQISVPTSSFWHSRSPVNYFINNKLFPLSKII